MKRRLSIALLIALAALPAAAQQDAPLRPFGVTSETLAGLGNFVEIGSFSPSLTDSADLVSEYAPLDSGALFRFQYETALDGAALSLSSRVIGDAFQIHTLGFDLQRQLRVRLGYQALPHQLGFDPLTNAEAVTSHARQLWATDANPGADYSIDYSKFTSRAELQLESLPALTLAAEWNDQQRSGHHQVTTVGHCEGCHVQSQVRAIGQATRGATLEALYDFAAGNLRASFAQRKFDDSTPYITATYDSALHPESRLPVFDDRLQYDANEGAIPVHMNPEIDRSTAKFDVALRSLAGFFVTGGGVWATTENQYTGLATDYSGFTLRAAREIAGWRLRWRGRTYSLSSDDVFVDTIERVGVAGPNAKKTYREFYGIDPDWTRLSSLSRDGIESRFDISHRFGKKLGSVRLLWDFESTARDHYEVAPGETETAENVLGVTWNARPLKSFQTEIRARYGIVDHPFMTVDTSCSTVVANPVATPFAPGQTTYDQQQDLRIGDRTASPSDWDEVALRATWIAGRALVTGSLRRWAGDNQEGDLTDWSRETQSATLSVWYAPAPTWSWYAAAAAYQSAIENATCIPVFDG